jgi:hypothetical protein
LSVSRQIAKPTILIDAEVVEHPSTPNELRFADWIKGIGQVGIASTGWQGDTPLWYYILREADVCTGGDRLGPVGSLIVTEVLVGLVDADATSFRGVTWTGGLKRPLANCLRLSLARNSYEDCPPTTTYRRHWSLTGNTGPRSSLVTMVRELAFRLCRDTEGEGL